MKTIYYLFVFILGVGSSAYSQVPDTLWSQTFGGSDKDIVSGVQQTSDGGYIIIGSTMSFGAGQYDIYLIKADASGIEQWTKTFGGSDYDFGRSVQQTSDGGYILTGYTQSFGVGSSNVYLIKTDDTGNELWSMTYGGINGDEGSSVQQTSDGGYIIGGRTYSYAVGVTDAYMIKTDASGTEQWSQTFGGIRHDNCNSIQQTSDGGFILVGSSDSFGPGPYWYDIYLIKTDNTGEEQWSEIIDENIFDLGKSVQQTTDGGYIIAGTTTDYDSIAGDAILVKTNDTGTVQWVETYGKDNWDSGYDVQQSSDGGYIIVGYSLSTATGIEDVYLIKADASGNEQWSKFIGGSFEDMGSSVRQTEDGGYIIAGITESFGAGDFDIWLIKLEGDLTGFVNFDQQQSVFVSPNPGEGIFEIDFKNTIAADGELYVYDLKGREVLFQPFNKKTRRLKIDLTREAPGVYVVKIMDNKIPYYQKIIKE